MFLRNTSMASAIATAATADFDVGLAGRQLLHHAGDGFDRPHDRCADDEGHESADDKAQDGAQDDELLGPLGIGVNTGPDPVGGFCGRLRHHLNIAIDGFEAVVGLTQHHRRHRRVGLTDVDGVFGLA